MSLTVKERRMNCLKVFAGRTIMTTEPKFVPNQAVSIEVDEGLEVNIRLVDCVGYTVPGAKGYEDENGPRMINTLGMKNLFHSMKLRNRHA